MNRQQADKTMWHWKELSDRLHDFKNNPNDEKTRLLLETMAQYRQAADLGIVGIQPTGVADGSGVVLQHAESYPAINAYNWYRGHS